MLRAVKDGLKRIRDWWYSKPLPGKLTLGQQDIWTVLPYNLPNAIVYSGGVGKNISFELALMEQFGARVFAFDPTQTGVQTIEKLYDQNLLHFFPVALAGKDGLLDLFLPVHSEEGSFTSGLHKSTNTQTQQFQARSISSLMRELGHARIDLLKIDIEGAEYGVLDSVLDDTLEIGQICVEFHHFFESIPKSRTREMIRRLQHHDYVLFHRDELNFSFCHKKLLKGRNE